MTVSYALLIAVLTTGIYLVASSYVHRSKRSYSNADRVWSDLNSHALELLKADIPKPISLLVVALSRTAGCGCFVRGALLSHYLPIRVAGRDAGDNGVKSAFDSIDKLTPELRQSIGKLLALVMLSKP